MPADGLRPSLPRLAKDKRTTSVRPAVTDSAAAPESFESERLPSWIRTRPPQGERYVELKARIESLALGTVCREARCPNVAECWSAGSATIMLLGQDCTRRCSFCAVRTRSPHGVVDRDEPRRVSEAVGRSGLRYVVLTQVCRDDLADGGAALLAETVRRIHENPTIRVELLIGDLGGPSEPLRTVLAARPDVLAHNIETVRSLSPAVRDHRASYGRSLKVLRAAHEWGERGIVTKSSIMLGLGESDPEVRETLGDLRDAGVDLVTFGQYLRPTPGHRPVSRFVPPDEFVRWKAYALEIGFVGAEAGPLVRSSYHADELYHAAHAGSGG